MANWFVDYVATVLTTIAAAQAISVNNLTFCGWPIAGDDLYSSRPSAAQASWDADAAQYATMTTNLAINNIIVYKDF